MNDTSYPEGSQRAILLMGPTASGKTACALQLAEQFPMEIVSVDSALVYRGMDVGTAKPSLRERAVCPHHLIDIISPEESYSAARFRADALELVAQISARGRIPLLVGGTMLYFKALREGLSALPHADADLRAWLDQRAANLGWPALHAELGRRDPVAAARLSPNDSQRIQRALEIVMVTGRPLADSYARREVDANINYLSLALVPSNRPVLHTRIAARFEAMLEQGLVDEVRHLRNQHRLSPGMSSMRCVGYRQAWEYLDGLITAEELRFKGVAATRQLAKRQLTWLRQFRQTWPELVELDSLDATSVRDAGKLVARWSTGYAR